MKNKLYLLLLFSSCTLASNEYDLTVGGITTPNAYGVEFFIGPADNKVVKEEISYSNHCKILKKSIILETNESMNYYEEETRWCKE